MRKIGLGFFLLVFLVSCGNKKTKMDPFATITNLVDSAAHKADTVSQAEVDNDPKPIEADESFDDFIYSYASDDALQQQRTKFPLSFYDVDKPSKIEKGEWEHDYLFTQQSYYTLLFDNEDDLELVGDTFPGEPHGEEILLRAYQGRMDAGSYQSPSNGTGRG